MSTATLEAPPVSVGHLYYLADYERNGYQDSDFFVVYWDDTAEVIRQEEFGSTRYAGNPAGEGFFRSLRRDVSPAIREKVRRYIEERTRAQLIAEETARIETPGPADLEHGTAVRFIALPSPRSKGEKWVIGDTGEVYWQGHFGTFYRTGYKRPTRDNGRLGVRLSDGRRVFCAMTAVRLTREINRTSIEAEASRAGAEMAIGNCVSGWTWATAVNAALKSAA